LNPSVVVYDELAQARNRELYDVLDTAMGARSEPLFLVISTQSNDPQHILSQLIDDGLRSDDPTTVTHLYAVPEDVEDIFDPKVWGLANPALGDFRSLKDLQTMADRAARMPSFEASFRNLYLNQRVDAQSPLIARSEWTACKVERTLEHGEAIYLGLDLSSTTDLTALVAVSAENGDRVKAWFWKPGDLIRDHENRDRAPYGQWARDGWLDTPPGRAIDYGFIARTIAEVVSDYQVLGLSYDRWRIENLMRELDGVGLASYVDGKDDVANGLRLVPFGQGFKDMAPAIDALEVSVIERRFAHDGNPVLAFCFSNAVAVTDPAGNRKLDKSKTRFRIDGAVAAAMALGLKARDLQAEPAPDPEIVFL
jgi:phage terminase large subunit-like protein